MLKLERILCPVDLSEDSERTLRYAIALARSAQAKLLVCHLPRSSQDNEGVLQTIEQAVQTGLTLPSEETPESASVEWESVILKRDSDLGKVITEEAAANEADLIFMRSRRRPFAAAILGSTAETVSRQAPCPVLVMHKDEREWLDNSTGSISLRRILVGYDFSAYSELALQYAMTLAQQFQAGLHMLHVLPPPITDQPEVAWVGQKTDTPYHMAARRLQDAVPKEVHLWSNVTHAVQYGQPYAEVLAYAEKHEIDLIALGAHGVGWSPRTLFGSNVDRVLRQAQCPVLVAHPVQQSQDRAVGA